MKKLMTLIVLFALYSVVSGQSAVETKFVHGEVMVQLENQAYLQSLLSDHNLKVKHVVSKRFNIYLLEFNNQRSANSEVITSLKYDKAVVNVQNNHHIELRNTEETLPNDSLFNNQWSLLNTGQSSGTVGADIDAELAWDYTTGGLTALGDTIVVATLDGGSDLNHEDLDFWKNYGEIPNNDIDDDNNGYVDDYDGWNAYNHSGEIPANVHGVHVCGIIGAIGNNDKGIAGVNWNVKTLPVAGESSYESIVVEALSYIYVVRERYDETEGAEGAFVVAQNNSFGVDKGQPALFPIWEAMYDSLGTLGVLSMGATANRSWDIDSVSDVPTAFTTDYMISVTNTTNKDKKNGGAAWGETTIDLGAPGSMILSLGLNNTYRTSSGTSMATPHVSGAAALLMAAADSAFIIEYKNNPAEGALLIKEYILNGVDLISDLEGNTVTGGRLNIHKSINIMLNSPILDVNLSSIDAEIPLDYTYEENLIITNTGTDTLHYSILTNDFTNWFTLSKTEGELLESESDTILVKLFSTGVDTGTYTSIITVVGDNVDNKIIPITMYVYDDTGINDNSVLANVEVYPNPFNSSVSFNFDNYIYGVSRIEIFNHFGNKVFVDKQAVSKGMVSFNWNSDYENSGIYYYKIFINNRNINSGKLIKL